MIDKTDYIFSTYALERLMCMYRSIQGNTMECSYLQNERFLGQSSLNQFSQVL